MIISGEWELNPEEVAAIFRTKDWCWHTDRGLTPPTPEEIDALLVRLVKEALEDDMTAAIQAGRFMVWKDPETPNSWDIYLNLGFVWDDEALGDEGNEELV